MSIDSNAAILHAPDLLSDEYDPELGRLWTAPTTPERALIAAIIRNAFDEAREVVAGDFRGRQKAAIIADARAWLTDVTSGNAPGTWGLPFCAVVPRAFQGVATNLRRRGGARDDTGSDRAVGAGTVKRVVGGKKRRAA